MVFTQRIESRNPCFSGSSNHTGGDQICVEFNKGRNPCFSGSSNHTFVAFKYFERNKRVAILVLVEVLITQIEIEDYEDLYACRNPCFSGSSNHTLQKNNKKRQRSKSQSLF